MNPEIDTKTTEELVAELINGTLDVNLLSLDKIKHREAFILALENRPSILSKVSRDNANTLLPFAVKINPEYFVQLKREQYTDDMAQAYVYMLLSGDLDGKCDECTSVITEKSLTGKSILKYSYTTSKEEELYFFDKELGVPISLRSTIALTVKLENAIALINKLDTHIAKLNGIKIKEVIAGTVANKYRAYLGKYVKDSGIGYYTLCTSLSDLQIGFKGIIERTLEEYGLSVSELIIKSITIPPDIQAKLEDRALSLVMEKSEVPVAVSKTDVSENNEHTAKENLQSTLAESGENNKTDSFECINNEGVKPEQIDDEVAVEFTDEPVEHETALTKAETAAAPAKSESLDVETTVTVETLPETEVGDKDTAPTMHDVNETEDEAHELEEIQKYVSAEKHEDTVTAPAPAKKNIFRISYVIASMSALVASAIAFFMSISIGLMIFGASAIILGLIATFNIERFSLHGAICEGGTDEEAISSCKLTNTRKLVLIASLTVGIVFIALGVVKCISDNSPANRTLYVTDSRDSSHFSVKEGKEYIVKFTPTSAGNHIVKMSNASLDRIADSKDRPISHKDISVEYNDYDHTYSVYLYKGMEYVFYVKTETTEIDIVIGSE